MNNNSTWEFGIRQVVFGAIGAVLYGVFAYFTSFAPVPAASDISFRPAVALLIFFSVAYGPAVGFIAGFVGNILADALGGGFYWHWDVGNGLMGMVPGLASAAITDFKARSDILKAVLWGLGGIAVGMLFASLAEIFMTDIDLSTAIIGNFVPAFVTNAVVTAVLLPILMIAFAGVVPRQRR